MTIKIDKSFGLIIQLYTKKSNGEEIISIPDAIFRHLNKVTNQTLSVGMEDVNIICIPNFTSNYMEISKKLAKRTGLYNGMECLLKISENGLRIGPVIGVFISNGSVRKAREQNPNFRYVEWTKANLAAKTILYFFSVKDIDFLEHRIKGVYFNKTKGAWESALFPFPDVLYDRGGGVLPEQKVIGRYIRKQLAQETRIKKINPQHYFDKWETFEKLYQKEEMKPYLPLTAKYQDTNDLRYMLNRYDKLYIKDRQGSNGRGIMFVEKLPDGYYFSQNREELRVGKAATLDDLEEEIFDFLENKEIIIQSAIPVLKIKNSNVDMRATLQRNGLGNVEITAYPVRVGDSNSPVTSTKTGSTVYRFEDFFERFMGYTRNELIVLKKRVEDFLYLCFRNIEDSFGQFAEIGIDFAIDQNGKLWFIECNAKPGHDTMYKSYDRETIHRTFLNPLEYAKYLTKF